MSNSNILTPYSFFQYGDFYQLKHTINTSKILKTLKDFEDKWSQYNPRKSHIAREGLCVFNYEGRCGPGPALDSLKEYNRIHGTNIGETDCDKPTELFWESQELQAFFEPLIGSVVRTHFLRLKPGGFFPPHRDHREPFIDCFRLIVPLQYTNAPYFNFVIDGKITQWDDGFVYFADTTKEHYLFNGGGHPSYWVILNIENTVENVRKVLNNLWVRV